MSKARMELLTRTDITHLIPSLMGRTLTEDESKSVANCAKSTTTVWAGYIDGDLVCIIGLAPPTLVSDIAYLWMHATDKVGDHEFVFVRKSQHVVEDILKLYPRICGHCEVGATRSIRWLKWLGAKFGEPDGKFVPFLIGA